MVRAVHYRNRTELLQGTLDLLSLRTLQWGPRRGYGISRAIRTKSGDVPCVDTSSLDTASRRPERRQWVSVEWGVSNNNQRVKVYRLMAEGRRQLASERSLRERLSEASARALNPRVEGGAV